MKLNKKSKKSQEEMIGFVLIVVLITIIILVFLGISIRRADSNKIDESKNIQNLLESLEQITTECETNREFLDIGDLIIECAEHQKCNNENACKVLERELEDILDTSIVVGEGAVVSSYNMQIYFNNTQLFKRILEVKKGDCESGDTKIGARQFFPVNFESYIEVQLELCYGKR